MKKIRRPRKFAANFIGDFPKPVIASVNGYAIGVGAIVSLACDLIVASDKSEWRLPQVALGIIPNYGGGTRVARYAGKGMGMKAHDFRVAYLCYRCHTEIDQGKHWSKQEKVDIWERAHRATIGWLFTTRRIGAK